MKTCLRMTAALVSILAAVCGICWFFVLILSPADPIVDHPEESPQGAYPSPSATREKPYHPGWYATDRSERSVSVEVRLHQLNLYKYAVKVSYSLTLQLDDPVAREISQGDWVGDPDTLITDLLGDVWVYPGTVGKVADWTYSSPQMSIDQDGNIATVRIISEPRNGSTAPLETDTTVVVEHVPAWVAVAPSGWPPVSSSSVKVIAEGFSIVGVRGRAVARDRRSVVVEEEPRSSQIRVVLVQDGYSAYSGVRNILDTGHETAVARSENDESQTGGDFQFGPLLLAVPWIAIIFMLRKIDRKLERDLQTVGYRISVTVTAITAAWLVEYDSTSPNFTIVVLLGVVLAVAWIDSGRGPGTRGRVDSAASAVIGMILIAWVAWMVYDGDPLAGSETSALTIALLGLTIAGGLLKSWRALPGVVFVALLVWCALASSFFEPAVDIPLVAGAATVGITSALVLWPLIAQVLPQNRSRRRLFSVIALAATAVLAQPLDAYFDPLLAMTDSYSSDWFLLGGQCLAVLSMVGLVAVLRKCGSSSHAVIEPAAVGAGLGLIVLPTALTAGGSFDLSNAPWDLASLLLLVAGVLVLMPARLARRATALGSVSRLGHSLLLAGDLHRFLLLKGARGHYRTMQANLSSGEAEVVDLDRSRRALERAEKATQNRSGLNSGGGYTPWQNAVVATKYSMLTTIPLLIGIAVWSDVTSGLDWIPGPTRILQALGADLYASSDTSVGLIYVMAGGIRWAVYGFFFGFFYTRLRGNGPMTKAMLFGLALAAPEVVLRASTSYADHDGGSKWMAFVMLAIFSISLGLLWERRLSLAAKIPWARVRRLDTFRSVRAGLSAVVVAILTAVGVALAEEILSSTMKK